MKHHKKRKESGFTLIELLITVAIIGILAVVAIPAFNKYQLKTKFSAGLSEISGGKTAMEIALNNGQQVKQPEEIGLQSLTSTCRISVSNEITAGYIQCEFVNASAPLSDAYVKLARTDSTWACITNQINYAPGWCTAE